MSSEKQEAVKALVKGAIVERDSTASNLFEGRFDRPEMEKLVYAIRYTDALDVLADVFGEKESE